MMKNCFVGFDTSNYTSSAAICTEDGEIVANIKIPLAVKSGECGLRQSDAVFAHIKNLPELADKLSDSLGKEFLPIAVGVSATPRDSEGSYMPCFLSGRAAAHAFAAARRIPTFDFSHQNGHIMAAAYSSGCAERIFNENFLALHVSGGTTDVLISRPYGDSFLLETVGGTLDLNAGQVIDRVGVMLGMDFPCGAALERLAIAYKGKVIRPAVSVKNGYCNLSGLENMARKLYDSCGDREAVAAFVFDFIERTLLEMCRQVMGRYQNMPVLFGGGVMSNTYMRKGLKNEFDAYFSDAEYSSDNACGIALLCRRRYLTKV